MTQYNQLELSNGVVAEVTDQSVYFEHESAGHGTALYREEFEEAYERYGGRKWSEGIARPVELTDEITMDVSDAYVHFVTEVLTTSVPHPDFERLYEFYEAVKSELQDPSRKAILVWEDDRLVAETQYASGDAVDEVVTELQSEYSEEYEIEVVPVGEFQGR